jgi:hypothetical protein
MEHDGVAIDPENEGGGAEGASRAIPGPQVEIGGYDGSRLGLSVSTAVQDFEEVPLRGRDVFHGRRASLNPYLVHFRGQEAESIHSLYVHRVGSGGKVRG